MRGYLLCVLMRREDGSEIRLCECGKGERDMGEDLRETLLELAEMIEKERLISLSLELRIRR